MKRAGVMLVEDNPAVARELRMLLAREFDVSATVMDGHSVVSAARALMPDVVVTDISLPGMDGMEAAEILCRERPEIRIVFITVHADRSLVERALKLGQCGYVLKADAGEDLVTAVQQVLSGRSFVSRSIFAQTDTARVKRG